jgi:peptidoglycan/xylan/chitin deacetylase (PgdA/CDA1 family)
VHPWIRNALYAAFLSWHTPAAGLRMILLYHSIGSASPLAQSAAAFRLQVRYVARWFHVVRLSDFLSLAADPLHRNLASITFDDGFADNATVARAVLDAAGVPGTFFVVTGRLGKDLPTSAGPVRLMTPADVKALADGGHEIGAHSVTHPQLTQLPADEVWRQVADSKRHLEDLLGRAVTSFSYPKGRVDEQVRQSVEQAGYRQAVMSRPRGFVIPPLDPYALPRLAIQDYVRLMLGRRGR